MTPENPTITPIPVEELQKLVDMINSTLRNYSDKDWNYSRITIIIRELNTITAPYLLWCETVNPNTKQGESDLKATSDEVAWGNRHSNELGILEIVSLRVNKALLDSTSNEFWGGPRPVLRLVKKELLARQGITVALWYEVREVIGEDFDNR